MEKTSMGQAIARREMIQTSALLLGGACSCRRVGETCFAVRGGSWTRCPAYRGRTGGLFEKLFDAEVSLRLDKCDPNPQYPPYPWDDDRGFRCVRRTDR
jgi:hypothetical protein